MGKLELIVIALGLSMDAFAVAVSKGLSLKHMKYRYAVITGCYFGGFQAFMPLLGYLLGTQFKDSLTSIDHWIAFILLSVIGMNMVRESDNVHPKTDESLNVKDMTILSLATSMDALAIGVTFAFLQVHIAEGITIIGITTFIFSFIGVKIGNIFGYRLKSNAELAGGIILIIMGIKILFEHLGVIRF
ncbi:manganese efflux pump MntP family protein [Sinanaerobacter chloroacetimidivorans]|jgi:putative Mn2+ efflux pump MntP|uniref:Putative manganese efflux pump MntP n=1 Tax=Sinanaerobacter chloroacetimidivorans TaxID=2818044 RepID=A0A8J7W429_9FIRM|nr:manganese efflux pump MntP family protein [Sinanaerobacter chloroacetimidivorans]MBR0598711.1 manganese efflux pump [Sinanaerobacter chloroacetimidivorans]